MFKLKIQLAFLTFMLLWIETAVAQHQLSNEALFHRCYSQLTQLRVRRGDPLLAEVRNGKTALQACTEVLDKAQFSANGGTKISNDSDPVAKAVLFSLHQLHRSWAREQVLFNAFGSDTLLGSETWYDDSPLGSYITRALFSPNHDVLSVVQGSEYLQPVRTTMDPPHAYKGVPSLTSTVERKFTLEASHPFAPLGELLGIRSVNIDPIQRLGSTRFADLNAMPDFENIGMPPAATTSLGNINFTDITAVRGPITEIEKLAIRIKGNLSVVVAGSYTLYLSVDDAGMLYLDGTRLIDRTSTGEGSAVISLSAGNHNLEVRYRQRITTAKLIMSWQGPSMAKQVVPAYNNASVPAQLAGLSGLQAEYYVESRPPANQLTGSEGAGFIGNHNYLLTTYLEADPMFIPNGAEKINRSWARAVLNDALCRDIPVVRDSDVEQFVIPESLVPFRQAASCNACHASIDRQAGLIRRLRYNSVGSNTQIFPLPRLYGILGMNMIHPSEPARSTWSDIPDLDYAKRPSEGHFFFRNYKGELVDTIVNSVAELGNVISQQDDFYACFAKRYYEYFTGIDVELGDPGNSTYPQLNDPDKYHRSKVIGLGSRLRSHKSLRQLILEILGSAEYQKSDFGSTLKG